MQTVNCDMNFGMFVCACCVSWIIWTSGLQVDGITLAPVYWNSSNPMFKISNNGHIIEVNLYDEIDFVCPYFSMTANSSSYEYYIIYQVTKQAYEDCDLHAANEAMMIVNCSNPNRQKRFTMLIETFQAIPNVPEFNAGHTYYYISTSSGTRDGLLNTDGGVCLHQNMKMLVKVCCDATTKSSNNLGHLLTSTVANQIDQPSLDFSSSTYPESLFHWTSLKDVQLVDATMKEQYSGKIPKTFNFPENNVYLEHKGLRNCLHMMLPLPVAVIAAQLFVLIALQVVLSNR